MPQSFVPGRLTFARRRRGLTKEQLAAACGVSRRSVTGWESGATGSPPVARLAAVLRFPEEFFSGPELDVVPAEAVSFRALSNLPARKIHQVVGQATIATLFWRWVDERFELPGTPGDAALLTGAFDTAGSTPAQVADSVRRAWSRSPAPIPDLLALLESKGVRVLSLSPEVREVDAFSFWREDRPYIFLNTGKSAERLRFDLAHELGHLVLHRGVRPNGSRLLERQANEFAAEFLMPAATLGRQVRGKVGPADVLRLRTTWRVSVLAMLRRLHELGLVTEWNYRSWVVDFTAQGYRDGEPGGLPPESSQLLRAVLAHARADGYGVGMLARELGVAEADLTTLLVGLTMTPVSDPP